MFQQIEFPSGTVDYWFDSAFEVLWQMYPRQAVILVTDEQVLACQPQLFADCRTVVIPAGEGSKSIAQIERLAGELLRLGANRHTVLVGVGGGVVTDITGFLASVFMRGIRFGFVPTTLLAMADAAIGGKNGVNLGAYKNSIGTITQPRFILYDSLLLATLPDAEFSNGFAEIIKYACLFDPALHDELTNNTIEQYRNDPDATAALVERCAGWKNKTVLGDEKEKGDRKLLNFGHTAGHALEKLYSLPHGQAVAIGMMVAARASELYTGLDPAIRPQLGKLLAKYHLPTTLELDIAQVMEVLLMDKKRTYDGIEYVLLEAIGQPLLKTLPHHAIEQALATAL